MHAAIGARDATTPLPLQPLRTFLRTVPDRVHVVLLAHAFNHLLCGQHAAQTRLAELQGYHVCLEITDTGNAWCFVLERHRLGPAPAHAEPTVRIRGGVREFLLLATRAEDPDTLFFGRQLSVEGDTASGLSVKNALDALEMNWPAHFATVLGPFAAQGLLGVADRLGVGTMLVGVLERVRRELLGLSRSRHYMNKRL